MHDQDSPFHDHLCYLTGQWIRYGELAISVDDIGFRQGVVAVERLRTYGGVPFQIDAHLKRWQQTTGALQIDRVSDAQQIGDLVSELLQRNAALVRQQAEVGITILATPGVDRPTLVTHLNSLNHGLISRHREHGQPLIITEIQQPSDQCWPRSIKVRSRIHYYLADAHARNSDVDAVGVLIDDQGHVTETSIANLAIVHAGEIFSPPPGAVLGGITQMVVQEIAARKGIHWIKRPILANAFRQADEVLLMGTDAGIWFARSVDGRTVGNGIAGEIYLSLRREFDSIVT